MNNSDFKIERITIAVTNMKKMVDFYSNVFGIRFTEQEMFGSKFYMGTLGELELLFCPAEIAGITADQNRHQFEITTPDIHKTVQLVSGYGGKVTSKITETNGILKVSIYDPDNNSMVFSQLKT